MLWTCVEVGGKCQREIAAEFMRILYLLQVWFAWKVSVVGNCQHM